MTITMQDLQESGVLPQQVVSDIVEKARHQSVIQRLSKSIPVPMTGGAIPVQTSKPVAGIVNETESKPVTSIGLSGVKLQPVTFATIITWSKQARVANGGAYLNILKEQLASAIATAFDYSVLTGKDFISKKEIAVAGASVAGIIPGAHKVKYDPKDIQGSFQKATEEIYGRDHDVTGLVAKKVLRSHLASAKDSLGRPIFSTGVSLNSDADSAWGVPLRYFNELDGATAVVGDFEHGLVYGVADQISISRSDQASVLVEGKQVNLWQHNLEAFRCEATIGWAITRPESFAVLSESPAKPAADPQT